MTPALDSRWIGLPLIAAVLAALVVTVVAKDRVPRQPPARAPAQAIAAEATPAAGATQQLRLAGVAALPAPPQRRAGRAPAPPALTTAPPAAATPAPAATAA
ncbi:MAG: hypothetical protein ABW060_02045, partial [Solirubrobacteraceae bacterium]